MKYASNYMAFCYIPMNWVGLTGSESLLLGIRCRNAFHLQCSDCDCNRNMHPVRRPGLGLGLGWGSWVDWGTVIQWNHFVEQISQISSGLKKVVLTGRQTDTQTDILQPPFQLFRLWKCSTRYSSQIFAITFPTRKKALRDDITLLWEGSTQRTMAGGCMIPLFKNEPFSPNLSEYFTLGKPS